MILLPWVSLLFQYFTLFIPVILCGWAFSQWNGFSKWLCLVVGLVMLAICGYECVSLFQNGNLTGLVSILVDPPLFLLLLIARTVQGRMERRDVPVDHTTSG